MPRKTDTPLDTPIDESIVIRSSTKNGEVSHNEVGNVIQTICREHRMSEGWRAEAVRTFNAQHGDHLVVTFYGLLQPIDEQRKVILL